MAPYKTHISAIFYPIIQQNTLRDFKIDSPLIGIKIGT